MHNNQVKTILALSLPLAGLIIVSSYIGLSAPGFYSQETLNWQIQSRGQDMIDLFLVSPLLIITTLLIAKKNKIVVSLWAGVNLYLVYTFTIYCFDVHFNKLFILYSLILGLSFYSFLYFVFLKRNKVAPINLNKKTLVNITAVYFISISCLFYFFWLSEIIPSILDQTTPKSLIETGLATNPVHIIDLSVILPGMFITGMLLFKKRFLGLIFAPVMLVFFILMDITIGGLIVLMKTKGLGGDYLIVAIMAILGLISLVLLYMYLKNGKILSLNNF